MTGQQNAKMELAFYKDNYDHLADELRQLDLLIQLRAMVFRQKTRVVQEAASSQPTYISHGEVDWLLTQEGSFVPDHPSPLKVARWRLNELPDSPRSDSVERRTWLCGRSSREVPSQ